LDYTPDVAPVNEFEIPVRRPSPKGRNDFLREPQQRLAVRPWELCKVELLHTHVHERLHARLHVIDRSHQDGAPRLIFIALPERHHALHDALLERRVLVQKEHDLHRPPYFAWIAPRVTAMLFEHVELVPHLLRRPIDVG